MGQPRAISKDIEKKFEVGSRSIWIRLALGDLKWSAVDF
jgi:hypothetical protein